MAGGGWPAAGGNFLSPQPPPPPSSQPEQPVQAAGASSAEPDLDQWRHYQESDRHWALRKQFVLRNLPNYPGERIEKLLSFSQVWTNHIFMGCR